VTTVSGISGNVSTVAGISADVTTVAADGSDIGTVAGISSDVTTVSGISGNVTSVAGNASNINTVAADGADIGTVATSITNVNTVATDIANVNTNATNIASINTNATNITDIQNASANAASALASKNDAATSATNSANSATASETSKVASVAAQAAAETAETNAETAQTAAEAAQTAAETAETNAATSETNAASSAASASTDAGTATTKAGEAAASASAASTSEANADTSEANALTYSSNAATSAAAAASSAAGIAGYDLDVIAETKGVTAVDVFVYDTSKDSDGGAWRKRTQHTSWYQETLNTATRGSRREFPAVAVIVAETTKVTIYDGDDPSLPMWMVFNAGVGSGVEIWRTGRNATSVVMQNGVLCFGIEGSGTTYTGVYAARFIEDTVQRYSVAGVRGAGLTVSLRNDHDAVVAIVDAGVALVNGVVNDVAMTVLPNAPIDAATGLPVPTIAVATDGGVSVITDSGAVYDITWANHGACGIIAFNGINQIVVSHDAVATRNRFVHVFDLPSTDISEGNGYSKGSAVLYLNSTTNASDLKLLSDYGKGLDGGTHGGINGLAFFDTEKVAYTTSTYNTGWMNGDIKGAFLSDTDDTDLVGNELVTNGTFDTDTDWTTINNVTIGSGVATIVDSASIVQTNVVSSGTTKVLKVTWDQVITSGTRFRFFARNAIDGANVTILSGSATGGASYGAGNCNGSGTFTIYVSTTDGYAFKILSETGNSGTIDNVSVTEADVDRSVNANPLTVNGTITRSPVATGADLVAYSGFSASNYLEQPYNSDLDFGTGDFCVMGWGRTNINGTFLSRGDGVSAGSWYWRHLSGSTSPLYIHDGSAFRVALNVALPQGDFVHFALLRRSGVIYLYGNGALMGSLSGTYPALSMSNATAKLRIGDQQHSSYSGAGEKQALLRISATAPTAEQIAKIYEDEKVLFQENAQATLYGSSDAVTALAHDDATNLLHVGTSAGRSVFQGLRRVENTTTAVGTAISASNSLVVEE